MTVQGGGDWDLKNQKGTIYYKGTHKYYVFDNSLVRGDAPGNIHYGYVGKSTWWATDELLFMKAGEAQKANPENTLPEWDKPPYYGDDPIDHYYIVIGIEYYKRDTNR